MITHTVKVHIYVYSFRLQLLHEIILADIVVVAIIKNIVTEENDIPGHQDDIK